MQEQCRVQGSTQCGTTRACSAHISQRSFLCSPGEERVQGGNKAGNRFTKWKRTERKTLSGESSQVPTEGALWLAAVLALTALAPEGGAPPTPSRFSLLLTSNFLELKETKGATSHHFLGWPENGKWNWPCLETFLRIEALKEPWHRSVAP